MKRIRILETLENLVNSCPTHSCENRCLSNVTLTEELSYEINNNPCKCDNICLRYNDCCPDYVIYCLPKISKYIQTPIEKLNYFQKAALLHKAKTSTYGSLPEKVCQKATYGLAQNYSFTNYNSMTSTCPRNEGTHIQFNW